MTSDASLRATFVVANPTYQKDLGAGFESRYFLRELQRLRERSRSQHRVKRLPTSDGQLQSILLLVLG